MKRKDIKLGGLYLITEAYCTYKVGTMVRIVQDDGDDRPRSESITDPTHSFHAHINIMTPVTSSKNCEICKTQKSSGCRCGAYMKGAQIPKQVSKWRFRIGDRIINHSAALSDGNPSKNAGKIGTIVDYDPI